MPPIFSRMNTRKGISSRLISSTYLIPHPSYLIPRPSPYQQQKNQTKLLTHNSIHIKHSYLSRIRAKIGSQADWYLEIKTPTFKNALKKVICLAPKCECKCKVTSLCSLFMQRCYFRMVPWNLNPLISSCQMAKRFSIVRFAFLMPGL
jgi:hypothetical protein